MALAREVPRSLTSVLAHDLRAPLNALLLSVEAARQFALAGRPVDVETLTIRIERNARLMLELIDSFPTPARPEPADGRLSFCDVRLDGLAPEIVDSLQPITEDAGVEVRQNIEAPICVRGDRVRLGQVLSNLLSNAIRHAPRGSAIDLQLTIENANALCRVADRGPGVPPSARVHIFEPGFQGPGAPGEAGLGLFICQRIIQQHGGRIWLEESVPHGACFAFALPLLPGCATAVCDD